MMDPQSVCAMGAQPIGAPACDKFETIHTRMARLRLLDGRGSQATDGVNALHVMDSSKRMYLLGEIRHAESLATVWISLVWNLPFYDETPISPFLNLERGSVVASLGRRI